MVDGVHRDAANGRALPLPAGATRLAQEINSCSAFPDGADRCLAGRWNQPRLTGREPEGRHGALLRHQLHAGASRASHLGARAGLQLDRVDHGTDGDVAERERVARPDLRLDPDINRSPWAMPSGARM